MAIKTTTTSTPQMTADWNSYFAGSKPGETRDWGGGTLTRNQDGTANFSYNGQNTVLRRDMPFQQVAALSPQIADDWYKSYGYTAPSNVTNQAVSAGLIPKMNATIPFSSQNTGATPDSPFGMAGDGAYAPPMKPEQFWQGGAYDPSKGLVAGQVAGQYEPSSPFGVGGNGPSTSGASGGSGGAPASGPTTGSGSSGVISSQFTPGQFNPWQVTPPQTVQQQTADIARADSPLMQQARGRAMQQMNERGLINSSLAVQAAQDAVLDRAIQIGGADAATNANAAQFNANQGNAWNLAQQEMEYKRWALSQNFENEKQLRELEIKYRDQLASDDGFQKQYNMYLDGIFQIDMNKDLDPETKRRLKQEQGQRLDDYVTLKKLNINMDFSDYWKPTDAPAPAPGPAPAPAPGMTNGNMFNEGA